MVGESVKIPKANYLITRSMWEDYYAVQQSGKINMLHHPLVGFFVNHDAWQKSFDHFETNAQTDGIIIEVKV